MLNTETELSKEELVRVISVLDAGSGFGNMSKTATKIIGGELKICILYDPLPANVKKH